MRLRYVLASSSNLTEGAVQYELKTDNKNGIICHCGTCRTISSDQYVNCRYIL